MPSETALELRVRARNRWALRALARLLNAQQALHTGSIHLVLWAGRLFLRAWRWEVQTGGRWRRVDLTWHLVYGERGWELRAGGGDA